MKTLIIIISIIFFSFSLYSQNIINTLGTTGVFKIKDGVNDYFTVNSVNGTIILTQGLMGSQRGSVFKGGESFLHTFSPMGANGGNTFLGLNCGNFSLSGTGTNSSYNTGVGASTLKQLTTGYQNSALGCFSLFLNTSGYNNSAYGMGSMYNNTSGYENCSFGIYTLGGNSTGYYNSAFGNQALGYNATGFQNSAFGYRSLYNNEYNNNSAFGFQSLFSSTMGYQNSAFGHNAMFDNIGGSYNAAFGDYALVLNTSGGNNTAVGSHSLYSNTTGDINTALGYNSGQNITTGDNNICLGYLSVVPSGSANNQVRIGNFSITYAGIQVPWTITSDRRWKENIKPLKLGLGFISALNPVSYTRKNDELQKTEYGIIAQELEEVLKTEGAENSGMLTVTEEGMYELRYNDLIAPMIKAIQELNKENEKLIIKNQNLEERLAKLEEIILEKNQTKEVELTGR